MRLCVKVHTTVHRSILLCIGLLGGLSIFGITQDSCRNTSNVYVYILVVLT
jgi:hypothetical protein